MGTPLSVLQGDKGFHNIQELAFISGDEPSGPPENGFVVFSKDYNGDGTAQAIFYGEEGGKIKIPSSATDDDVALLAASQTFTNKVLTNPTINGATLSGTIGGAPTFSGAVIFNNTVTLNGHTTLANTKDLLVATDGGSDLGATAKRFGTLFVDAATITDNATIGGTLGVTQTVTFSSVFLLSSVQPQMRFFENDQAADEGAWRVTVNSADLVLQSLTDAFGGAVDALKFIRGAGTAIAQCKISTSLYADQSSSSGAVPVLILDQADIDDTFINLIGTSAADSTRSISSSTAEAAAKFGAFRVEINGTTKWVRVYDSAV